ncbi:MAG: PAS domain-containing protein [bacterium]|nr:PAS domain-containing protein [bacterium]
MIKKRLLWQLFPLYLIIVVVSMVVMLGYYSGSLREMYLGTVAQGLEARANLLIPEVTAFLDSPERIAELSKILKEMGIKSRTRITVILPNGEVAADSDQDPAKMENHAARPEVITALSGNTGIITRYSNTLDVRMMYGAVPLLVEGKTRAVIRTAVPISSFDAILDAFFNRMVIGACMIALAVSLISWWLLRRFLLPLEDIRNGVQRFANGDLTSRIYVHGSKEIVYLARLMNKMAMQLNERIDTVVRQRNELDAVFSSMTDGVIAVDSSERIISINRAAVRLLELEPDAVRGKLIHEAIRNADLQNFVRRVFNSAAGIDYEFRIYKNRQEQFFKIYGAILKDSQGQFIGAVVIITDITQSRKLEIVRRDFVANVSHELRTPIAAIKGASELLISGDIDNDKDKAEFLSIIDVQTERLSLIIDDLLALSRIEQEENKEEKDLSVMPIKDVIASAIHDCEVFATEKKILIKFTCDDNLTAKIQPRLLEQAVVNLIENAIKYSDAGSHVAVAASEQGKEVIVSVKDNGCGIPHEHLSRIFERFYRVDKSRSRKNGGTGLGLAIVKHIAHLHGGRVDVESKPNSGSTFYVTLQKS